MKLSKRLNAVVDLMESCGKLCDIGCDHGYVSIESVLRGRARYSIAADTAKGPLDIAEKNICDAGLKDSISCILSDGFKRIPEDAGIDCVVITGMGGRLIKSILKDGADSFGGFNSISQFILGPQSEPEVLRSFLINELSLCIKKELCIEDEGKFYTLLDVRRFCGNVEVYEDHEASTGDKYGEADIMYGKYIDEASMDTYIRQLMHLKNKNLTAISMAERGSGDSAAEKIKELKYKNHLMDIKLEELDKRGIQGI